MLILFIRPRFTGRLVADQASAFAEWAAHQKSKKNESVNIINYDVIY